VCWGTQYLTEKRERGAAPFVVKGKREIIEGVSILHSEGKSKEKAEGSMEGKGMGGFYRSSREKKRRSKRNPST